MSGCRIENGESKNTKLPDGHPPISVGVESCPYSAERQAEELASLNQMPHPSQVPHPTQKEALSTDREISSIPMGGKHSGQQWVYPSEQVRNNAIIVNSLE